jgi:hypothetical protein
MSASLGSERLTPPTKLAFGLISAPGNVDVSGELQSDVVEMCRELRQVDPGFTAVITMADAWRAVVPDTSKLSASKVKSRLRREARTKTAMSTSRETTGEASSAVQ